MLEATLAVLLSVLLVQLHLARDKSAACPAATLTAPPPVSPLDVGPGSVTQRSGHVVAARANEPALVVDGGILVRAGTLTAVDVVVGGRSLDTWLDLLDEYAADVCRETVCVHGQPRILSTCTCKCDADWTGLACDTNTCHGHGTWNAVMGQCDCVAPWLPDEYCRRTRCVGGALSETVCETTSPINDTLLECAAPVAPCGPRVNWGVAHAPTELWPVGLCPGGFRRDSYGAVYIVAAAMLCNDLDASNCTDYWDQQAPICCAPTSTCAVSRCGDSVWCCSQLRQAAECTSAGCAWCSDRVCLARHVTDGEDCLLPSVETESEVDWRERTFACTPETCPPTAVSRYFDIIRDEGSLWMAAVAARHWPELAAGALHHMHSFRLRVADQYLAVTGTHQLISVAESHAAAVFVSVYPATAFEDDTYATQLFVLATGEPRCVADPSMSTLLRIQLVPTADPVQPLSLVVPASDSACGRFTIRNVSTVAVTGSILVDAVTNRSLVLAESGSVGWSPDAAVNVYVE